MNFDANTIDFHATEVQTDPDFQLSCTPVDTQTLASLPDFESAPDVDDDKANGKSLRFASSFVEGTEAESRFAVAAKEQGWKKIATSKFDDKIRRIDAAFKLPNGQAFLTVDIKAAKKLSRSDSKCQYRYHWLELHETGSLFCGDSTVLALEVGPGRFALFNKSDIRKWLPLRVQGPPVFRSTQALFRPYKRAGKLREWITMVDIQSMLPLCKGII